MQTFPVSLGNPLPCSCLPSPICSKAEMELKRKQEEEERKQREEEEKVMQVWSLYTINEEVPTALLLLCHDRTHPSKRISLEIPTEKQKWK